MPLGKSNGKAVLSFLEIEFVMKLHSFSLFFIFPLGYYGARRDSQFDLVEEN